MTKFVAAFLILFSATFAQTVSNESAATKAVLKLCKDWDDAYIKRDAAPLEKMLTADYIGIDHEGAVTSKADEINLIKSGDYIILSVEHLDHPQVRVYGSTAIVTSKARVKHSEKGMIATILGRATTVCVNQGGHWKIASWHASRLKE